MAFSHGKNALVFIVDSGSVERNISTGATEVSLPRTADTAETSALGTTDKAYIAGMKDAQLNIQGPRDATNEGYLDGVLGSSTTFSYFPEGSASGKVKYSGTIIPTSLDTTTGTGDAARYTFAAQCTGAVTRTVL